MDAAPDPRAELSLAWLTRLRWGAVLGPALAVAFARLGLGAELPLAPVGALLLVTALSNLAVTRYLAAGHAGSLGLTGGLLTLDTLILTGLLALCGGPSNPFSALYLVDITLSAVVLGPRWTWFLTGLSVVCYALLFFWYVPVPQLEHAAHHAGGPGVIGMTHLQAMWFALTVAALLTATFVVRLSSSLESKGLEVAAMREKALRVERLAAVTTLAAGAAHELGSPLATIAVASSELEKALSSLAGGAELAEDARLIRSEVGRCREVLARLSAQGGEVVGEAACAVAAAETLADALAELPRPEADRVLVEDRSEGARLLAPRRALARSLRDLLRNALEASPADAKVRLLAEARAGRVRLTVVDRGAGMDPGVLARAGEPFFSTRPPGHGLGLGLFLARSLCEQLGGRLQLDSRPGDGTAATLDLPGVPAGALRPPGAPPPPSPPREAA